MPKQTVRMTVRMTRAEHDRVTAAAGRIGKSAARYLVLAALEQADTDTREGRIASLLRAALADHLEATTDALAAVAQQVATDNLDARKVTREGLESMTAWIKALADGGAK